MWRCETCGYIWQGDEVPDACPKCEAQASKFAELDAKAVDLIEKSKYSNSLHMALYAALEEIIAMAQDGIDENLDPSCVGIFEQAADQAEALQQLILAEIQGHVKKNKWG